MKLRLFTPSPCPYLPCCRRCKKIYVKFSVPRLKMNWNFSDWIAHVGGKHAWYSWMPKHYADDHLKVKAHHNEFAGMLRALDTRYANDMGLDYENE